MNARIMMVLGACIIAQAAFCGPEKDAETSSTKGTSMAEKLKKSDDEWRCMMTSEQYKIMRQKGTEMAFTGALLGNKEHGVYRCAACGAELFKSDTKFESGTGWPSFYAPVEGAIDSEQDVTHGMLRTEVMCAKCGGHLGHVFDDGPKPTGMRYCINSAALKFEKRDDVGKSGEPAKK